MKLDFRPYLRRPVILTTFVVFLASLVLVRLGLWQVSRYYQRQQFNDHYLEQTNAEMLDLDAINSDSLDLSGMEYRKVTFRAMTIPGESIVRINQYFQSELGYSLITPYLLRSGSIVFVDRGWIPSSGNETPDDWDVYNQNGVQQIIGLVRIPITVNEPNIDRFWVDFDYSKMQARTDKKVLPIFIQQFPAQGEDTIPPIPQILKVEISEGPHAGYALQWFTFAIILLAGYPFYLRAIK